MMVYQSVDFRTEQGDLNRLAIELARHLIPRARPLSSQMGNEAVHLLLQTPSKLTAFDLYNRELGEEAFEIVLRITAELESKRREQNNPLLKGIQVYLLAKHFPKDILRRIPLGFAEIRLFEWSFIRSEANDAILVREVTKDINQDKALNHVYQSEPLECLSQQHFLRQELNTPELVAFVRLGMELRGCHHSQIQRPD